MENRTARMKREAMPFNDLMFNQCRPRETIDLHVGTIHPQHNPGVGDGKQAFIHYFWKMAAECPGKIVECWVVLQIIPETSEIDNGVFDPPEPR